MSAEEADRLKRRGLYVDMDRGGRIREPSEITEAEVTSQLARARQAAGSAGLLLGPEAQARLANPPAEAIELARALVSVLTQTPRYARTPEAAVDVMLNAVSTFRNGMAVKEIKLLPWRLGSSPRRPTTTHPRFDRSRTLEHLRMFHHDPGNT